jgi:hypothetical protein
MTHILLVVAWSDTLSLVGICFTMVLLIMLLFVGILKVFNALQRDRKTVAAEKIIITKEEDSESEITGEEAAAIAVALRLYFDVIHDNDSRVLTIKRITRCNSPWCLDI